MSALRATDTLTPKCASRYPAYYPPPLCFHAWVCLPPAGMRAAREQEQFGRDQQQLAAAQIPDAAHADQLVLRRLALAREDPVRGIDAREAARAAATKVASWLGEEGLRNHLQRIDPLLAEQLELLQRGEPLASAMAAVTLNGRPDAAAGGGMEAEGQQRAG